MNTAPVVPKDKYGRRAPYLTEDDKFWARVLKDMDTLASLLASASFYLSLPNAITRLGLEKVEYPYSVLKFAAFIGAAHSES